VGEIDVFIITRRNSESVILDGFDSQSQSLKVTVLKIEGGNVRLGLEVNRGASVRPAEPKDYVPAGPAMEYANGGVCDGDSAAGMN
jgi:sRNA-binding carbon storage regulator CsrA